MAKRSVKAAGTGVEIEEAVAEMTEEEIAATEAAIREEREERLAPYRAVHAQQNDQDDLLAELLFEVDLLKFGLDE